MTTERLEIIETWRLVPYANNARTHSAEQILKLRSSLREFGFVNPILIDEEFNVIAGHGRLEAAKTEGLEKVPCVFVEHLNAAQKRAYILADNRIAEMSGWNEEILKIELDGLREMEFDVNLTGFEDYDFQTSMVEGDNFDIGSEMSKPATAQIGDVWHLGRHKIFCGDATKAESYSKLLGAEKVNLVLTRSAVFRRRGKQFWNNPKRRFERGRRAEIFRGDV